MSETRIEGKPGITDRKLELGKTMIIFCSVGLGIKTPGGKRLRFKYPWANRGQDGNTPAMATEGYAQEYVAEGYPPDAMYDDDQYGTYENDGYSDSYAQPAQGGRFNIAQLYQSEWSVWVLLLLVPPLGLYLLWQRNVISDIRIRMGVSAVALIWFIVLLFWIFSGLFGVGGRQPDVITPPINQTTLNNDSGAASGGELTSTDGDGDGTSGVDGDGQGSANGGGEAALVVLTADPVQTPLPSPTPILVTCYMTDKGTWYHKVKNCLGMQGAIKTNTEAAKAAGKTRCTKCWDSAPAKGTNAATGTTLKNGYVWLTSGGTYYHIKRACTGMQDATQQTLAWAVNHKYKWCPNCKPPKTAVKTTPKPAAKNAKKTTPKPKAKG